MNEVITIENTEMQIKEYNGQRVVTFKDIDTVHQRPKGTADRNFRRNKKHFIEGEDFVKVCVDEIRCNKIMDISPKARADIILITESGYLMLVKSFTDDLAWTVQRQLVNGYFKAMTRQDQSRIPMKESTSYIPKVPLVQDWYDRNRGRIERFSRTLNVSKKELYHNILKRIGERYDLEQAREIYKDEVGHYPIYAMDVVGYFPELGEAADVFLDRVQEKMIDKKF